MSNARKILLVEGDLFVRTAIEQALSGKGYTVITASSGEDALWKLDNGAYDAVFTEMAMRGMSGLDVAEEIHSRQPRLPVVIITSEGPGAAQERAANAGVTEFLVKPLSPEQIAKIADRLVPATASAAVLQPGTPAAEVAPAEAAAGPVSRLKNIFLFLLAPLVGLAYLLAFPIFALGMVVWKALQQSEEAELLHPAAPAKPGILKTVVMMITAVLVGIIFAVISPLVGIGFILWFGFQAWGKLGAKAMVAK